MCLSGKIKKKSRYLELKIDKIQIADSPEPINSAKKELSPQTYLKVKEISEDEGHTSTKREVTKVLESFDASPGFGDFLKKLLPEASTQLAKWYRRRRMSEQDEGTDMQTSQHEAEGLGLNDP